MFCRWVKVRPFSHNEYSRLTKSKEKDSSMAKPGCYSLTGRDLAKLSRYEDSRGNRQYSSSIDAMRDKVQQGTVLIVQNLKYCPRLQPLLQNT